MFQILSTFCQTEYHNVPHMISLSFYGAIPAIPISPCAVPGQRWGTFVGHRRRLPGCLRGFSDKTEWKISRKPFKIPMKDGRIPFNQSKTNPWRGWVSISYISYIFKWHPVGPVYLLTCRTCQVAGSSPDETIPEMEEDRWTDWAIAPDRASLCWKDMSSILKASSAVNQFNPTKSNLPILPWVQPSARNSLLGQSGCDHFRLFHWGQEQCHPSYLWFLFTLVDILCRGIPFKTSPNYYHY